MENSRLAEREVSLMREMKYLAQVVTLALDEEKCKGCGICLDVCPHEVLALKEGKIEIIDRDGCMECGACMKNCPCEALTVKAGVGCAAAVIMGFLKGTAPDCDCGGGSSSCCG
jgi:ferredoxin